MPSKTSENIDPDNAKITSEQRPFTVIVEGNIGSGEILLQFTYLQSQCLCTCAKNILDLRNVEI